MSPVDARALASWLAAAGDDVLTRLLVERRVTAGVGWSDFFDAAEALLEPGSLVRAAGALEQHAVTALDVAVRDGSAVTDPNALRRLVDAALVTPTGVPYAAVATAWPSLPRADLLEVPAGDAESDAEVAERVFAAIASLADVLHLTLPAPLGRTGAGTLGAVDRRRLVEAGAVVDADAADDLLAIGAQAGLLRASDREWRVTGEAVAWLELGTAARWVRVADGLRSTLPAGLRTTTGGWVPVARWGEAYPLDPHWPDRALRLARQWRRWGIVDAAGRAPGWAEGFAAGGEIETDRLQQLLPGEVDRIFLQNDLSAIAPGPLEPAIDARLRRIARRETRAQASTYRFSSESLGAALAAGEDADELAAFLASISLTGLPQPLAYELERAATRHGRIRVGADAAGGTEVTASDPTLLDTLVVDQALRPLGLVPGDGRLVSRATVETVFWMLADARYPAVAVDLDGRPRRLQRARLADESRPEADPYTGLIARLRDAHENDADAAWLGRELEQAVRGRTVLEVSVRLPDGGTRAFVLEATGLGGGRLRGRDRAADVERTLPVASIVSVQVV